MILTTIACAPSDAAADVICERLSKHFTTQQLFRLNWWQRTTTSIPIKLRPYCYDVNDIFEIPNYNILTNYQIIVCKCGTSGILRNINIEFDIVYIDEASQAIESECYVPLELTKRTGGIMVLAGDSNQLGPSTHSPFYDICIDKISLQERLLRLPCYLDCLPHNIYNTNTKNNNNSANKSKSNQYEEEYNIDSSVNTSFINLKQFNNNKNKKINSNSNSSNSTNKNNILNENNISFGVFLYQNYRSHGKILEIPSRLFYGNTLQQCINIETFDHCYNYWDRLVRDSITGDVFPMLCIGVDGIYDIMYIYIDIKCYL